MLALIVWNVSNFFWKFALIFAIYIDDESKLQTLAHIVNSKVSVNSKSSDWTLPFVILIHYEAGCLLSPFTNVIFILALLDHIQFNFFAGSSHLNLYYYDYCSWLQYFKHLLISILISEYKRHFTGVVSFADWEIA